MPLSPTFSGALGRREKIADHTRIAPVAPYRPVGLVLVVADPDHREVVAGVAGEPAVAAVVAGAGLAGRLQAAEAVARAAGVPVPLVTACCSAMRDQARGDGVAFLRRRRRLVVAVERLALGVEHAAHRVQRLDLAAGGEELVQLRHRVRALVDRAEDQRRIRLGLDAGQGTLIRPARRSGSTCMPTRTVAWL